MVAKLVARLVGGSILATGGWWLGSYISETWAPSLFVPLAFGLAAAGAVFGLAFTLLVVAHAVRIVVSHTDTIPTSRLLSSILGLITGLVVALLLSIPLSRLSGWFGVGLPIALSIFLAYLGAAVMAFPGRDVFHKITREAPGNPGDPGYVPQNGRMLMDTSAIIDGRVASIGDTGFLRGTLTIPRFVLDELQKVADSKDSLRRTRGRRGLEMLNKLRNDESVPLEVLDVDYPDVREVDSKLVGLAKELNAPIITTDYNLNRVAQIQGVDVLNINELANSLKPIVHPGEGMTIRVVQEGREPGQGVGFLDDGTMVVVESGGQFVNKDVDVLVTRVLQNAAGSIIFSQLKRG